MDKHPIDKIFSEGLSQRDYQFSSENWNDALALINAEKKRRKKIILWWFLGSLMALLILFMSWNVLYRGAEIEKHTVQSPPVASNEIINNTIASNNDVTTSAEANKFVENGAIKPASTKSEKDIISTLHKTPKSVLPGSVDLNRTNASNEGIKVEGAVDNAHILSMPILDKKIGQGDYSIITPLKPISQSLQPLTFERNGHQIQAEFSEIYISGIKPVSTSLLSGWTAQLGTDLYQGLLSGSNRFADLGLRMGYQKAINKNIAFEIRSGLRYFNGELPVHAQVRQVEYLIGSEVTTFQLQADQLIMGGLGVGAHFGHKAHRLSIGYDIDLIVAAYGSLKEQFFIQERKLQDRNAKPVLVSESRNWLALAGLNRWQHSSEVAYRYAINPDLEIGLAWIHRFTTFVVNDELPADRMSLTVKKIF